jgi:hypothetical protein
MRLFGDLQTLILSSQWPSLQALINQFIRLLITPLLHMDVLYSAAATKNTEKVTSEQHRM